MSTSLPNPILIRILDADGVRYDRFVLAPAGMSRDLAVATVSRLIEQVKEANPEDYLWEDLEALLKGQGFSLPETASTTVKW
jgi:hypothetical protein